MRHRLGRGATRTRPHTRADPGTRRGRPAPLHRLIPTEPEMFRNPAFSAGFLRFGVLVSRNALKGASERTERLLHEILAARLGTVYVSRVPRRQTRTFGRLWRGSHDQGTPRS